MPFEPEQPNALRLAELFEIEDDLESLYRKTAAELRLAEAVAHAWSNAVRHDAGRPRCG